MHMNSRLTAHVLGLVMLCFLHPCDRVMATERCAGLEGPWIVSEGRPAPWVSEAALESLDESLLVGMPVEFRASEVISPSVFGCDDARYEKQDLPVEGLFQGSLPAPAKTSAANLGFSRFPVPTARVTCRTGVHDYHRLKPDALVIAVDNVIWTLVPARSLP